MDDNKKSSVVSDKQSLPSNEGQSSDENTDQPQAEENPVQKEATGISVQATATTEEAKSETETSSGGEDIVASADQSLSEPGEDDQNAQAMTSVTSSEPVTSEASEASLTGENDNVEPKTDEPAAPSSEETEPAEAVQPAKSDTPGKWYVIHTYSGHENKVAVALKQRIESEHLENKIFEVLVPMQNKIEIKGGKKATIKEKIFPGYILVKMVLDDASWLAVRTTQGVTSFVGIGNKPTPISDAEVATIVRFTQEEAPVYKQVFAVDDTVKIVDGPFAEFIGKVDSIDEEKGKVRVLVSIFGRETPVELDFLQVTKI